MADGKYLFVDFDDTLSDQFKLNTQYVREVGALLAPKYGGEPEAWAKATADMLEALEKEYVERFVCRPLAGYREWLETVHDRASEMVFAGMGLQTPPDSRRLAIETQFAALASCDAAFPGAYDALLELYDGDYRVQMASGQESEYLLAALMGAGIESFTESKFGPDLVDCAKEGPEYYERIFGEIGVKPSDTLVVDDHPQAIAWALKTGVKVVQVRISRERRYPVVAGVEAVITELTELPALVKRILG